MKTAFDPRDPAQNVNDPTTWKDTANPVLIASSFAIEMELDRSPVYWDQVAHLADYCDEPVRTLRDDVEDLRAIGGLGEGMSNEDIWDEILEMRGAFEE